jgi:hypothetical protein
MDLSWVPWAVVLLVIIVGAIFIKNIVEDIDSLNERVRLRSSGTTRSRNETHRATDAK